MTPWAQQLAGALWKGLLLKRAAWMGTMVEVVFPVGLLSLMILMKDLADQYDAPSIAYTCGPARPFDTSQPGLLPEIDLGWVGCFQRPDECPAGAEDSFGYYQLALPDIPLVGQLYAQLGSINFLSFTVGDTSGAFSALPDIPGVSNSIDNPSLTLEALLVRLELNNVVLALVPAAPELAPEVGAFEEWVLTQAPGSEEALQTFESEAALEDFIRGADYENNENNNAGKIAFALIFEEMDRDAAQWKYTIRANYTSPVFGQQRQPTVACLYPGTVRRPCRFRYTVPSTREPPTRRFRRLPSTSRLYGYTLGGFSTLQLAVDQYILFGQPGRTGAVAFEPSFSLMPVRPYQADNFFDVVGQFLGLLLMLAFIFPTSRLIRGLTIEKETKLREGMQMMGLEAWVLDLSWLLIASVQMLVTSALIVAATGPFVFEFSNNVLLFLWVWLFSMSSVAMCFCISAFFSRSKTAATLGTMIYFGSYFPYYAVSEDETPFIAKQAMCVFPPTCIALGSSVLANFEVGEMGLQWSNLAAISESNFNFLTVLLMLFFDVFLYFGLYWYASKVLPSEYGTQRHPLFLCQACCSCCRRRNRKETGNLGAADADGLEQPLLSSRDGGSDLEITKQAIEEPVSDILMGQVQEQKAVVLRKLSRDFDTPSGKKRAVVDLSLTLYEGQISVLLGPNGAGKSTTISMLTGLIPLTQGEGSVRGLDLRTEMSKIRKTLLGVCAQDDRLFPDVSVDKHLSIYALFKSLPPEDVEREIATIVTAVGLTEKRAVPSNALSGGMKRKLGLAIALLGGSRVVVLDEPTSGMDPFSRRSTWELIKRAKENCVLLLTTHFMDEADILGDRIAIMNAGQLTCCGTSLFLKRQFGVGYTLSILLTNGNHQTADAVKELLHKMVPTAETLNHVGSELTFRLPFEASGAFSDLMDTMDADKNSLSIVEYGISVTKLEEVFMKVSTQPAVQTEVDQLPPLNGGTSEPSFVNTSRRGSITAYQVIADEDKIQHTLPQAAGCLQFKALFLKRAQYAVRDFKGLTFQLIVPAVLVVSGLLFLTVGNFANIEGGDKMPLRPYEQFNLDKPVAQRSFVPFTVPDGNEMAQSMFDSLDGDEAGIQSTAVPVDLGGQPDVFGGCAQSQMEIDDGDELLAMSSFLLNPEGGTDEGGSSRYGAIVMHPTTAVPADITVDATLAYNVLVNSSSVHGGPTYMNVANQAALRYITGLPTANIEISSHPLPLTRQQQQFATAGDAFASATFIMIAFSFIPASYAIFVVKEREHGSKHQQMISGVGIFAYWGATWCFDVLTYLIPAGLTFGAFFAFEIEAYIQGEAMVAIIALLMLFGPAVASFTYMISFCFKSHSNAQNVVLLFNFVTGLALMITSFMLDTLESTQEINQSLKWIYRLLPAYCLGDGLVSLSFCDEGNQCPVFSLADGFAVETLRPLDLDVTGLNLIFLVVHTFVYLMLTLLLELLHTFPRFTEFLERVDSKLKYQDEDGAVKELDSDVAEEKRRISIGERCKGNHEDVVRLDQLRKVYPSKSAPKVAVQCLSFGIPRGECFGFLGINGAGKTTTLKMLSGDIAQTSGSAHIEGHDIVLEQVQIRRYIGYCPQHDALLELLSVRQHLQLFARIKGVGGGGGRHSTGQLARVVDAKMKQLDLEPFADKLAGSLSGGNKRKLSVAIATIGAPSVVFLDEPSTGMDPVARRFMWRVLSGLKANGTSLILTTHSMEEAEALCDRIGIMVNGQLTCLGSSTHLKNVFGRGLELELKLPQPTNSQVVAVAQRCEHLGWASTSGKAMTAEVLETACAQVAKAAATPQLELRAECSSTGLTVYDPHLLRTVVGGRGNNVDECSAASAEVLCSWWLSEATAAAMDEALCNAFPSCTLLERASAASFRYRVSNHTGGSGSKGGGLGAVFAVLEGFKKRGLLLEYSAGQTTLEQIFNQFASGQENPEVE